MALLHVSYDPVRRFVPRVPKKRLIGEDGTVRRICVSPTIEDCINAKPGKGAPLAFAREKGIPVVLYVYEFDKSEYVLNDTAYNSCRLQRDFGVRDALLTGESWLLVPPVTIKKRVLLVEDFELESGYEELRYPRVQNIRTKEFLRRPPKCLQSYTKEVNRRVGSHLDTGAIFTELYASIINKNLLKKIGEN